jgi:hypothetical protein
MSAGQLWSAGPIRTHGADPDGRLHRDHHRVPRTRAVRGLRLARVSLKGYISFIDLSAGPMVVETPPMEPGTIVSCRQAGATPRPVELTAAVSPAARTREPK